MRQNSAASVTGDNYPFCPTDGTHAPCRNLDFCTRSGGGASGTHPSVSIRYSNSMMTSSTAIESPALALIFRTTPCRSARRTFSIFIASTVQST